MGILALARITWARLSGATSLDLGHSGLSELPPEIGQLSQLQTLDIGGNQLTELPPEIGQLSQLQNLYLHDNQLTELPPEIGQLPQLQNLYLPNNQLVELPPEIGQLSQLQKLDLPNNQLVELPPEIGQLSQLQNLSLPSNRLTELPPEIGQLSQLQNLSLHDNQVTELPPEIGQLSQLQNLSLPNNWLTELPPEIGQLSQLQILSFRNNRLTELPPEIGQLSQLQNLSLPNNWLTELPLEIGQLSQLQKLHLDQNHLQTLPQTLSELQELKELYLHGNDALAIPAEVLGPTWRKSNPPLPTDILEYYFRSLEEASRPLLEAKILIVGQGGVGKTSLVQRLVHDTFDADEPKTEGIDIVRWDVAGREDPSETIRVNVWDFGGQEIMHATHQFFLTRRSVYLLVLDARKGENEGNLYYWLRIIRSFGGDSPVLVITNKCDGPNRLDLDETRLRKDFQPNIQGFFRTSCQTGDGIEALRRAIHHQIQSLEHVYDTVPQTYFAIKQELETRTQKEDFLKEEQYEALCREQGVEKPSEQRLLLRFLHDLGSVLHFEDEDGPFRLQETKILNPEWVTRGVYKLLNNLELMQAQGVLQLSQLGEILRQEDGYPKDRRFFILGMMRRFELCFPFPEDDGRILIPELLSRNEPDLGWEDKNTLRFEVHYPVLPEGLLPRFITRNHQLLTENPTYWRRGVMLRIDENPVLVRANTQIHRLYIAVAGPPEGRPGALTAIRADLQAIHRSFSDLEVQEMVPLPKDPGRVEEYEHLLRLEAEGEQEYLPRGAKARYGVQELLDPISTPNQRIQERVIIMGDKYEIHGQVGAVGPNAKAENNTFQQIYQQSAGDLDLQQLAKELAQVRQAMLQEASKPEEIRSAAAVAEAEEAAQQGDGPKAMERLRAAGKWGLDVATKIGTAVAIKALQAAVVL